jgi:hypothetical protein
VAIGPLSLRENTSGNKNIAIGGNSMLVNTTGQLNTAIGRGSMLYNTVGCRNTAIGAESLRKNNSGTNITAIGVYAAACNTSGINHTVVGHQALFNNTTGSCHIAIGFNAQCLLNANVANTISVGVSSATSATSNHTVWGNSSNNVCNCVYAAWANVSDCRDKTNIKSLPEKLGLQFIKKLKPVAFNWDNRETYVRECGYEYGQKDGNLVGEKEHYGFIAQELRDVLQELNVKFDGLGYDQEKDAYRLTYEELIASIVKSIQELELRVTNLENK